MEICTISYVPVIRRCRVQSDKYFTTTKYKEREKNWSYCMKLSCDKLFFASTETYLTELFFSIVFSLCFSFKLKNTLS